MVVRQEFLVALKNRGGDFIFLKCKRFAKVLTIIGFGLYNSKCKRFANIDYITKNL